METIRNKISKLNNKKANEKGQMEEEFGIYNRTVWPMIAVRTLLGQVEILIEKYRRMQWGSRNSFLEMFSVK